MNTLKASVGSENLHTIICYDDEITIKLSDVSEVDKHTHKNPNPKPENV